MELHKGTLQHKGWGAPCPSKEGFPRVEWNDSWESCRQVETPAQHIEHKTTLPTRTPSRKEERKKVLSSSAQKRSEQISELGVESRATATQRKLKSLYNWAMSTT